MDAIHNARVQLLATALNNLGVGAIIAGAMALVVNGTVGDAAPSNRAEQFVSCLRDNGVDDASKLHRALLRRPGAASHAT